ncbi:MAG: hypothetical protein U5K77_00380 [Candidatus Saccharibacteria bacterium]|nr:hypothetical protein [Candidatus Saccharibacteria bacterium]
MTNPEGGNLFPGNVEGRASTEEIRQAMAVQTEFALDYPVKFIELIDEEMKDVSEDDLYSFLKKALLVYDNKSRAGARVYKHDTPADPQDTINGMFCERLGFLWFYSMAASSSTHSPGADQKLDKDTITEIFHARPSNFDSLKSYIVSGESPFMWSDQLPDIMGELFAEALSRPLLEEPDRAASFALGVYVGMSLLNEAKT